MNLMNVNWCISIHHVDFISLQMLFDTLSRTQLGYPWKTGSIRDSSGGSAVLGPGITLHLQHQTLADSSSPAHSSKPTPYTKKALRVWKSQWIQWESTANLPESAKSHCGITTPKLPALRRLFQRCQEIPQPYKRLRREAKLQVLISFIT
jgi:hypothetical protein